MINNNNNNDIHNNTSLINNYPATIFYNNNNNSSYNNNDINDNSTFEKDITNEASFKIAIIILYSAIFFLGLFGNSLIVCAVAKCREMRTPTFIFIGNLAVSDVVLCALGAPFTPLSGLLKSWVFGDVLCHLVPTVLCLCVHVSTQTSTAIALERYLVIVYPFKRRMSLTVCIVIILFIWLLSAILSSPIAFNQTNYWDNVKFIHDCREDWSSVQLKRTFTLFTFALHYICPCSVIAFCYCRVTISLNERAKAAARRCSFAQANNQRNKIQRKRRTNKMLIMMIVFFVLCWMPLNIVLIVWEFDESIAGKPFFIPLFFATHLIAVSSTVYNPFLYAWMNEKFRKEFQKIIPCYHRFVVVLKNYKSKNNKEPGSSIECNMEPYSFNNTTVNNNVNTANAIDQNRKLFTKKSLITHIDIEHEGQTNAQNALYIPLLPIQSNHSGEQQSLERQN